MKDSAARHSDEAVISPELLKQLAYNDKMAELGKISAGVVHELNSPLSVIVSAAQMVMREDGIPEHVLEMIERISSEAQRLSQLAKGLLHFSSHTELLTDTDINITIAFILDFVGFEASKRGVVIVRNLDYSIPVLLLDGNVLKQVLLNLVMNAIQALDGSGGEVVVETFLTDDNGVNVVVSDNGPGIPDSNMGRIFDRYFTTKKPGEGTGLGLFVTKRLVENMGGCINALHREGGGTVFKITLLVASAA